MARKKVASGPLNQCWKERGSITAKRGEKGKGFSHLQTDHVQKEGEVWVKVSCLERGGRQNSPPEAEGVDFFSGTKRKRVPRLLFRREIRESRAKLPRRPGGAPAVLFWQPPRGGKGKRCLIHSERDHLYENLSPPSDPIKQWGEKSFLVISCIPRPGKGKKGKGDSAQERVQRETDDLHSRCIFLSCSIEGRVCLGQRGGEPGSAGLVLRVAQEGHFRKESWIAGSVAWVPGRKERQPRWEKKGGKRCTGGVIWCSCNHGKKKTGALGEKGV